MGAKNIRQKGVELVLDGTKFNLIFDMVALAELDDMYEGGMDEAMEGLERGKIKSIFKFVWAGIQHQYPEGGSPTYRDIMRMVDTKEIKRDLENISKAILGCMKEAFPDAEEIEDKETEKEGN